MSRSAKYTTLIVVAHLLVNIAHGVAHRELRVGLTPSGSFFVIVVVLMLPLLAMGLVWTSKKQIGLVLLSASMFAALIFGVYYHFMAAGPDHVYSQPSNSWGNIFALTAYALFLIEALGTYVGIHYLRTRHRAANHAPSSPRNQ